MSIRRVRNHWRKEEQLEDWSSQAVDGIMRVSEPGGITEVQLHIMRRKGRKMWVAWDEEPKATKRSLVVILCLSVD